MSVEVLSHHIVRDEKILNGEPIIGGTETTIRAVAKFWRSGCKAEEIQNNLPHLTMGQIFDALSYYCDYQTEIDEYAKKILSLKS